MTLHSLTETAWARAREAEQQLALDCAEAFETWVEARITERLAGLDLAAQVDWLAGELRECWLDDRELRREFARELSDSLDRERAEARSITQEITE